MYFFSNKCIYYSIFVGPLPTYTSSSDKIKIIIIMNLRPYNNFLFELCFRLLVKSLKTCCLKKILLGSRICIYFLLRIIGLRLIKVLIKKSFSVLKRMRYLKVHCRNGFSVKFNRCSLTQ